MNNQQNASQSTKNLRSLSSEETSENSHQQIVGYLKLKIVQAELHREQDYYQTQTHFIKLTMGDMVLETPVQNEPGLCPAWDHLFEAIPIYNKQSEIEFQCYERNKN